MKGKGKISIGKVHVCGSGEEYVSITIEDEPSGIEFLRAKMSLLDFAEAITGRSYLPVEYELAGTEIIGKTLEVKTETICFPLQQDELRPSEEIVDSVIKTYEVDGWMGSREDCKNHHNHVRHGDHSDKEAVVYYRIRFHRWVDKQQESEVKE